MCLMGFFKIWCEKCSVQLWLRGFWFSTVLQEWFSCIRQMISFVPREEWRLGVGIYASWSGLHWRNTLPLGRGGRGLLLIRRSVKGVQRRVAGVNSDFKYWDAKDVSRRKVCVCVCSLWPRGPKPARSSLHGIFQARILEQVAISYSKDLPDPGIKPVSLASPALARGFFTNCTTWEAQKGSTWC